MSNNLLLKEVDGVTLAVFFSTECFQSALRYRPKATDIFVASYPKCGTTWMQNIVINILRKGKPLERGEDFFLASPFIDLLGADDSERLMIRPGAFKTHLPFHKVPWSSDAKYIYVARNPRDCCVSFYHHTRNFPVYRFADGSFDDFFERFISGEMEYGDYFDHLLSWYEHRTDDNVFFITYEELKRSTRDSVLKVAHFLGEEYGRLLERDPDVFEKVLHYSSFGYMKDFLNAAMGEKTQLPRDEFLANPDVPKGMKHVVSYYPDEIKEEVEFVRKGVIGDWKNYFSTEQNTKMKAKIAEKTSGSDVMSLWNDCA